METRAASQVHVEGGNSSTDENQLNLINKKKAKKPRDKSPGKIFYFYKNLMFFFCFLIK